MVYRSNEPYNDLPLLPPAAARRTRWRRPACCTAPSPPAEPRSCRAQRRENPPPPRTCSPNPRPWQSLINAKSPCKPRLHGLGDREHRDDRRDALRQAAAASRAAPPPPARIEVRYRTALRAHGYGRCQSCKRKIAHRSDHRGMPWSCRDGQRRSRCATAILGARSSSEDVAAGGCRSLHAPPCAADRSIVALLLYIWLTSWPKAERISIR